MTPEIIAALGQLAEALEGATGAHIGTEVGTRLAELRDEDYAYRSSWQSIGEAAVALHAAVEKGGGK